MDSEVVCVIMYNLSSFYNKNTAKIQSFNQRNECPCCVAPITNDYRQKAAPKNSSMFNTAPVVR